MGYKMNSEIRDSGRINECDEKGFLGRLFKLKQNGTTVRTEVVAGITTFVTMAYILAVNPSILSLAGMPRGGVFMATVLAAIVGTFLMAFLSNYPFVLAPGMGPNAFLPLPSVSGWGIAGNLHYWRSLLRD